MAFAKLLNKENKLPESLENTILVREGVHTGWMCKQESFENMYFERTGEPRTFDPRIFNLSPCGSRMLVVREKAPEEYGNTGLVVPETARQKNPPGAGYVVAVGNTVGMGSAPHPHGVNCENPGDLLYKRIIFGMFSGNEFITQPYKDGGYETTFWIMTDRDVWFVDWSDNDNDKLNQQHEIESVPF